MGSNSILVRIHLWVQFVIAVLCGTACASNGPTRLCDGFESYETVQQARQKISDTGKSDQWQEKSEGTAKSDPRTAYKFLTLVGPFSLSGIQGQLKLVFYNDRLMTTEFSTEKGREYLTKLKEQQSKIPENASTETVVDRHTKFRYDSDPDGKFRFSWTDSKIEAEWLKWVRDNS